MTSIKHALLLLIIISAAPAQGETLFGLTLGSTTIKQMQRVWPQAQEVKNTGFLPRGWSAYTLTNDDVQLNGLTSVGLSFDDEHRLGNIRMFLNKYPNVVRHYADWLNDRYGLHCPLHQQGRYQLCSGVGLTADKNIRVKYEQFAFYNTNANGQRQYSMVINITDQDYYDKQGKKRKEKAARKKTEKTKDGRS